MYVCMCMFEFGCVHVYIYAGSLLPFLRKNPNIVMDVGSNANVVVEDVGSEDASEADGVEDVSGCSDTKEDKSRAPKGEDTKIQNLSRTRTQISSPYPKH